MKKRKLEVGIHSYNQTTKWFDSSKPEEGFRLLREYGFEAMDYNIDTMFQAQEDENGNYHSFFDKSEEELLEFYHPFKEAAKENGISIAQMHALWPAYLEGKDKLNAYHIVVIEKMMFVAHFLECPAIVVHPFFGGKDLEHEKRVNLDMFRRLIPAAKKYGVKVCLENTMRLGGGNHVIQACCSDAAEVCWYIDTLNEEAGEEVFGFCLDTGHANVAGRDLERMINALGKRLTILHIHDNNGTTDEHMIPFTQYLGPIEWEDFIRALKNIGYEGPLCFEAFRGLDTFPEEVRPQVMKLISAIGHYFKKQIAEGDNSTK